MRVPRGAVYQHISRDLGWSIESVHFGVSHKVEDLEVIFGALQRFHAEISVRRKHKRRTWRKKKPATLSEEPAAAVIKAPKTKHVTFTQKRRDTLSYEEQQEAYRELRERRQFKSNEHERAMRFVDADSPLRRALKFIRVL